MTEEGWIGGWGPSTFEEWAEYMPSSFEEDCAKSAISAKSPPTEPFSRLSRFSRTEKWTVPDLEEAALFGLAGRWAEAVQPYTEASAVGVLISTLVAFGSAVGRGPYSPVTATRHHGNEFALLIGSSSTGRKGEAMTLGMRPLRLADEMWSGRVHGGFGSGEAVVDEVRDGDADKDDEGASDKRLLVHEAEFASVLAVASRDGSTLSPLMRQAWDGGPLENRTKARKAVATGAHISVLAAITRDELLRCVGTVQIANGFLNRFLLVAVRRSKTLPEPTPLNGRVEGEYVEAFAEALAFARRDGSGQIGRDEEAREIWRRAYVEELSIDRYGLAGEACSRAEAHTLRLSLLYALLDRSAVVRREHMEAALALWRYCERSALLVFGDRLGDPVADAIDEALAEAADGLTRDDIRRLFSGHRNAAELDNALATLVGLSRITVEQEPTGGRPARRYFRLQSGVPLQ